MPYAPLQFGQAYRPSISYGLAGRLHEASWTFRMASDPFHVQPIEVVVAKPEEALVFRIRKNVGSVAAGIESSGHPISDSALVPERDGFDYAIKIPALCETGCSYKLKFTGELNAQPLWRRVEVPRQPGKFPPKLLSAVAWKTALWRDAVKWPAKKAWLNPASFMVAALKNHRYGHGTRTGQFDSVPYNISAALI